MSPDDCPTVGVARYFTRLRNTLELADEMGVSRDYIVAMRHHGFRMPGGKASIKMTHDFLSSSEEFKVKDRPQEPRPPQAAFCGIDCGPTRKNVRRKPLSGSQNGPPHTA